MKIAVYLFCCLFSECLWAAGVFSTEITKVNVEPISDGYVLNVDMNYNLSPVAKEALQKGISLTWDVLIKVKQRGDLWDSTLQELDETYQIQKHTLLNLYSVKRLTRRDKDVFSTLAGALNYMSKIRALSLIGKQSLQRDKSYYIAIKVAFKHESLPVPIRPFSYFDSQWALSSPWMLWPIQN